MSTIQASSQPRPQKWGKPYTGACFAAMLVDISRYNLNLLEVKAVLLACSILLTLLFFDYHLFFTTTVPEWSGVLTAPFSFEVYKDGVEFESINITKINKGTWRGGRRYFYCVLLLFTFLLSRFCVYFLPFLLVSFYIFT